MYIFFLSKQQSVWMEWMSSASLFSLSWMALKDHKATASALDCIMSTLTSLTGPELQNSPLIFTQTLSRETGLQDPQETSFTLGDLRTQRQTHLIFPHPKYHRKLRLYGGSFQAKPLFRGSSTTTVRSQMASIGASHPLLIRLKVAGMLMGKDPVYGTHSPTDLEVQLMQT